MDRLNQLRGEAGASGDSTLDASSPPSEGFMTANESSSKYFSMSEVDSTFSISPTKENKDESMTEGTVTGSDRIISNLSPIPKADLATYKIGDQIEAANILSGGVDIFDDNENSYDGDELVIDDAVPESDDKASEMKIRSSSPFEKADDSLADGSMEDAEASSPSKDTEVVLQIDGKNVDAIDIGNGLYLYRKEGEEELAAVQILDDDQQPNIKFLKVRENAEGNLEVYEEIEIEVPKEVPIKEGKTVQNTSRIPIKDKNKIIKPTSNKVVEKQVKPQQKVTTSEIESDIHKDNTQSESNTEVNLNGKKMKFSESRKSPLIGSFTPMTYHSTPNKEGIPLTKTMVDLQLHPNRHFENVKKTIEVHTDNCKQRLLDTPVKNNKESIEHIQNTDINVAQDKKEKSDSLAQPILKYEDDDIHGDKLAEKKSDGNCMEQKCDKEESPKKENNSPAHNAVVPSVLGHIEQFTCNADNNEKDAVETLDSNQCNKSNPPMEAESNIDIKDIVTHHQKEISNVEKTESTLKDADSYKTTKCSSQAQSKLSALETNKSTDNEDGNQAVKDLKSDHLEIDDNKSKSIEIQPVDAPINSTTDLKRTELDNRIKNQHDLAAKDHNEYTASDIKLKSNTEKPSKSQANLHKIDNSKLEAKEFVANDCKEPSKLVIISPSKELSITCSKEIKLPENKSLNLSEMITENIGTKTDSKIDLVKNKHIQILESEVVEVKIDAELKQSESNVMSDAEALLRELEDNEAILQKELEVRDRSRIHNSLPVTIASDVEHTKTVCTQILAEDKTNTKIDTSISDLKVPNLVENLQNVHESSTDVDSTLSDEKKAHALKNVLNIDQPNTKVALSANMKIISKNENVKNVSNNSSSSETIPLISESSVELFNDKVSVSSSNEKIPQNKTESLQNVNDKNVKPVSNCGTKDTNKIEILEENTDKNEVDAKEDSLKVNENAESKPNVNESKPGVPFGKWTEVNRQEFLIKIKESKVAAAPNSNTNTKQIKQANDLNRRDVLQKIDSQRQSSNSAKAQESNSSHKKQETPAFVNKTNIVQKEKATEIKESVKKEDLVKKTRNDPPNPDLKKASEGGPLPCIPTSMASNNLVYSKKEPVQRKEFINNQDIIDKTVEGIINRAVTGKLSHEDIKPSTDPLDKSKNVSAPVSLDDIETKMNELHGIPFVERPPHELPQVLKKDKSLSLPEASKTSKSSKLPNLAPFANKNPQNDDQKVNNSTARQDEVSDEEIIEHEPITGDIELNKNNLPSVVPVKEKVNIEETKGTKINSKLAKEAVITENEFDKFARRNSVTYENCLTVSFDTKESHNVVQTVVEKEVATKKLSRNEIMLAESKAKSNKNLAMRHNHFLSKIPTSVKQPTAANDEETYNKNYQSKVQMAYQSVITAKRQQEHPITIIEDKPVKVVFMESNTEFTPHQLNAQGQDLSPPKKSNPTSDWDNFMHSNSESLDSDVLDAGYDSKSQDDIKFKSKHQRKQVLTPVETPELELIEPSDLGIEVSPKKKRKLEDYKPEKSSKTLVPKKSYLLNRNPTGDDPISNTRDLLITKTSSKDTRIQNETYIQRTDPISAIDNLVKAAELLETQSENKSMLLGDHNSSSPQSTPVKRGRGRPRKYPIPETGTEDNKAPSPQKKPRLIDAKVPKHVSDSEDSMSSDGEMIKENWTMGKINENIVCPICSKLFRSENVVFKHVKHCTGPSPNRSESDKRSPRSMRHSQESECKSEESQTDTDIEEDYEKNKPTKKKKSKDKTPSVEDKNEVIVIEDTPDKETADKREKFKHEPDKTKLHHRTNNNLVCEYCSKTFRQLSYLVNHKLQHKKELKKTNLESKKEKDPVHKSLFTCEICKKEFRKLHHLVQHRIIHNPNAMPSRLLRKSSSEQNDTNALKDVSKQHEDQSAGFRCEPCDKSFRKLHHLVEHRETHDEMNKKCVTTPAPVIDTTKPVPVYNCEVCKKTFKKLQYLNEHKEQHLETSSEKSDDKSVKSCLSTRDIIHECPLCYMVFPNEHSLTKHTIICQRKKKQSKAKQVEGNDTEDVEEDVKVNEANEDKSISQEKPEGDDVCVVEVDVTPAFVEKEEPVVIEQPVVAEVEVAKEIKPVEPEVLVVKDKVPEIDKPIKIKVEDKEIVEKMPVKVKSKKVTPLATNPVEIIKIPDTPTPKKRMQAKEKIAPTVTKRQKTTNLPLPVIKTKSDSSDDDEVRYMLNPDFKVDDSIEGKLFMKVRAQKRNSLQIERPSSQDLVKRRISLQHPPKIPRLKVKPIERRPINTKTVVKSSRTSVKPILSSDSEDNDVKYSFPDTAVKELTPKDTQKKSKRKSVVENRKSLATVAKRKSLAKVVQAKPKLNTSSTKTIKKRTTEVEHRCDCGQLFSSAALLSRHTSLAHTPPRIRRRRSPPPETNKTKPKTNPKIERKSRHEASPKPGVATRKSSVNNEDRKSKVVAAVTKTRRSAAHKGVPVPEKMRKLMEKSKK